MKREKYSSGRKRRLETERAIKVKRKKHPKTTHLKSTNSQNLTKYMKDYFAIKPGDCNIYSKDGFKFNVHKVI